ncbi:MAG: HD domain-containing protein [Sideroxydans sp.]|nr:HD domain-containing protein [Sideroxydans sp.]
MFDHVVDIFSAGHTALAAFILILILEIKYYVDLGDVFRRRARAAMLSLLGVFFIFTSRSHLGMEGASIDMEGVAIALAALFGGPALAVLVTVIEILARIIWGGSTMMAGIVGLLLDFSLMMVLLRVIKEDRARVTLLQLVYAGLTVGIGEVTALLAVVPKEQGSSLFVHVGLELFLIQLLGTLLFGWLLKMHTDRFLGREHGRARIRNLNEAMKRGLTALSTAMVHHDLSTAGHEQRVADLSVRVGMLLGLSATQLEGLQLAAMVHDVGQIRVPRDILTRPRQLTAEEFDLVKLHVEAGYHILKDIPFPWPIANIVRQHHEHMDGTGYPNGLHGAQLLLESRILHACDALEAMLSHRPFRRAYSIERALGELEAHKSSWYDAAVVDAILKLFMELDYAFPNVKLEMPL